MNYTELKITEYSKNIYEMKIINSILCYSCNVKLSNFFLRETKRFHRRQFGPWQWVSCIIHWLSFHSKSLIENSNAIDIEIPLLCISFLLLISVIHRSYISIARIENKFDYYLSFIVKINCFFLSVNKIFMIFNNLNQTILLTKYKYFFSKRFKYYLLNLKMHIGKHIYTFMKTRL